MGNVVSTSETLSKVKKSCRCPNKLGIRSANPGTVPGALTRAASPTSIFDLSNPSGPALSTHTRRLHGGTIVEHRPRRERLGPRAPAAGKQYDSALWVALPCAGRVDCAVPFGIGISRCACVSDSVNMCVRGFWFSFFFFLVSVFDGGWWCFDAAGVDGRTVTGDRCD